MVDLTIIISILGSLFVSFVSLRNRLNKEREERYKREQEEWNQRTAALCEQIEWELELLDETIDVSDRKGGMPLGALPDDDALSHLDSLIKQLLEHNTNRPPDIELEISTQIRKMVLAYLQPEVEPGKDVDVGDIRDAVADPLQELKDETRTGDAGG